MSVRVIESRALGISPDWLRRLEREGRIPAPRRDLNGYRRYTLEDLEQIKGVLLGGERPAPQVEGSQFKRKSASGRVGQRGTGT